MKSLIERLYKKQTLSSEELHVLLENCDDYHLNLINKLAQTVAQTHFGKKIFVRGLIEIGNCCHNNCYYCGIRSGNKTLERYRLSEENILDCCYNGYQSGFRTFVLQSGEDPFMTDEKITAIVSAIRRNFPDVAITLSLGEKEAGSYKKFYEAGATRYLLRHETYNQAHYNMLHPCSMSLKKRLECLYELKEIGYQTGTGIMVGSPFQTITHLVEDILFIKEFCPEMIGIGPFLPHHQTPFADKPSGTLKQTLLLLSVFRLMHPYALIPATTALSTLAADGRKKGILAGANVVMPNLSPPVQRKKYELYDHKACTGAEAAEGLSLLEKELQQIGYTISKDRGDYNDLTRKQKNVS